MNPLHTKGSVSLSFLPKARETSPLGGNEIDAPTPEHWTSIQVEDYRILQAWLEHKNQEALGQLMARMDWVIKDAIFKTVHDDEFVESQLNDLRQNAREVIMDSLKKYRTDYTVGAFFYACTKSATINYMRDEDKQRIKGSLLERRKQRKIEKTAVRIEQEQGELPESALIQAIMERLGDKYTLTLVTRAIQNRLDSFNNFQYVGDFSEIPDEYDAAETRLEGEEFAQIFEKSFERLKEDQRQIILLRFAKEMPLRDIGKQMGITESGACVRLKKALNSLRDSMIIRGARHYEDDCGNLGRYLSLE